MGKRRPLVAGVVAGLVPKKNGVQGAKKVLLKIYSKKKDFSFEAKRLEVGLLGEHVC